MGGQGLNTAAAVLMRHWGRQWRNSEDFMWSHRSSRCTDLVVFVDKFFWVMAAKHKSELADLYVKGFNNDGFLIWTINRCIQLTWEVYLIAEPPGGKCHGARRVLLVLQFDVLTGSAAIIISLREREGDRCHASILTWKKLL